MKTRELCNLFGGQRAFGRACNINERVIRRKCQNDAVTPKEWQERIKAGLEQKIKDCSEALKSYT